MTDETDQALPESGSIPASETPETESVAPDTTPDVPEVEDQPEAQEKPTGIQKRISELVHERNEARRTLEAERRRLDQVVEMLAQQRQAAPEPEPVPPTLEQFQFDEDKYRAAVIDYAQKQATVAARAEIQQWQAQQAQQAKAQSFKARESEFAKSAEDYADTVYDPSLPITAAMAEVIQESEVGPQLAYHLAKNRAVAEQLAKLPERAMAREIGRLEAKLSVPAPRPVPVTKAPPPPPKIEATAPEVEKNPEDMPVEEWVKWREKQIRNRNKGR